MPDDTGPPTQVVTNAVKCYGCGNITIFTDFVPVRNNFATKCACGRKVLAFRDFKYVDACSWSIHSAVVVVSIKTSQLHKAVHNAIGNLDRLVQLARLPPFLTHWGRLKSSVDSLAWAEVFGEFFVPIEREVNASQNEKSRLFEVRSRVMEEYRRGHPAWNYFAGISDIGRILASTHDAIFIAPAIDTILSSLIIGSYTAFEAFAEDLWVAAINHHPQGLSDLKGKPRKKQGDNATTGEDPATSGKGKSGKGEQKTVPLELLQSFGYDLSGSMGHLLRERQDFDRFEGIRDAYVEAFYCDRAEIDNVLADQGIVELSAIRNNLIHNGGIVDGPLMKSYKSARLKAEYALEIDAPIPLDGKLAGEMMLAALRCTAGLARAVDEWLAKNPSKVQN